MIISSIRLLLLGAQVGWMMKTSLPRTCSVISTLVSPSLKQPTAASPKVIPSCSTTRCARTGCAFPENIFNSATMLSQARSENGWGGGTRTPACKDQNLVPYQLGDTPMIIFRRLALTTCSATLSRSATTSGAPLSLSTALHSLSDILKRMCYPNPTF